MNPADVNPIREGFIRQRRNLMIISLVLLFAETAELTINKLNIFGNELLIAHPATITTALWIAYFYWLWRYSTYLHDLGDTQLIPTYRQRRFDLIKQIGYKQLRSDTTVMEPLIAKNIEIAKEPTLGEARVQELAPNRFSLNFPIYGRVPPDEGWAEVHKIDRYPINAPIAVFLTHVRAWIYVIFRTRLFSEYALPYFVAALPLIYGTYLVIRE